MSVVVLPATFTALIAGLKFWEDKKSLSEKEIKDRDDAVNVVLDALILTKSYLYDRRELKVEQDRCREEKLSKAWQDAANAIYRFDEKLFQSAQVKAMGWADPRDWVKAEDQGIEVKLETLIKQCEWLKEQKI
ncbi:hypothetical protein [Vibrio sp. SCSIO 43155]|uniref:hypothetical protein n=1 Tax=Vibrio sp. SCSIO 43155 TaxID=2819099 RepID=UPI0020752916|nr:hypothetical protein [Vibrio sp. SCSIO 43155]ELH7813385.1 hypothetical protein [Vibrio harveyi]USD53701.1 hypothetical protein J4N44_10350 [Vibrio sp. SCSIO 43155]